MLVIYKYAKDADVKFARGVRGASNQEVFLAVVGQVNQCSHLKGEQQSRTACLSFVG